MTDSEDGVDEGMYPRLLDLFISIDRSVTPVLIALQGRRIRDNVRLLRSPVTGFEYRPFLLDT